MQHDVFTHELVVGQNLAEQNGNYCFENPYVSCGPIQIRCGGFIPVDSTGELPTLDQKGQCRLVFSNLKKALESMGSNLNRGVNMIIFLKNMDY
mgnify:FL=1